MALFSTFLLLITLSGCCFANNIEIERGVSFPTDDFHLPTSLCPNVRPLCSKFNAHQLGGCWCNCPEASSFYEHEFKCVLASEARQNAGCELGFTDDAEGNSLPFFPPGSAVENFINVPANQNCSFYFGNELHVNYLRCDGTWKSQSLSGVIEVTSGWSTSQLSIKLKPGSSLPASLAGRTVRVAIQCGALNSDTPFRTTCVMFKIKGVISCAYPQSIPAPSQEIVTLPTPITREKKPTTATPNEKQNTSLRYIEDAPINCVLGSTVVFNSSPSRQCGFLSTDMFNCCRVCNLDHSTCVRNFPDHYYGVKPHCYRGSYKCMCKCLEKHNVPENYYQ